MKKAEIVYVAAKEDEGKRVDTVLKRRLGVSSSLLRELKLNGKIKINQKPCISIDLLCEGDVLTADVTEDAVSENIVPRNIPLDIVYEDEFILIVNKPKNMSVHPSHGNFDNTLANGVIYYWKERGENHKFHAVNRLDKDTSGLCIIAKNRFAHGVLSEETKTNILKKRYAAVAEGIIEQDEGTIKKPIKRAQEGIIKRVTASDGKAAVTHYKVLARKNERTLLDIFLETGRTHQIRVHFSDMGHPLVGDWLYGNEEENEETKGHLLCAYYVEFCHPKTKEFMSFSVPFPREIKSLF